MSGSNRNMFGVCRVRTTKAQARRLEAIARRHDVSFVEMVGPDRAYLSWFDGPNRGEPFDRALAKAVREDVEREGLECEQRGKK